MNDRRYQMPARRAIQEEMEWSQEKYLKALDFAAVAHGSQVVPGKAYSYIVHLASVSMEIMAIIPLAGHIDADLAVQCALLHDVLEDTETRPDELGAEFGPAVLEGVTALTKNKNLKHLSQPLAERLHGKIENYKSYVEEG